MLTPRNWRLETVARLLLAMTTAWLLAAALALGLSAAWKERGGHFPPIAMLAITGLGFHGVGLVLIARFLRWENRDWRGAFGLGRNTGAALRYSFGWTCLAGPAVYGLHQFAALELERLGWPPSAQDSVQLLVRSGWLDRGVIALFAVVLAPVVEELLFRGILFPALRDAGWPRVAMGVASFGFGLIHGNATAFLPLSALGGYLAWLYLRTGNLLAPILAHFLFNLVPFILIAAGVDFGK
ncbi:MAG: CPBP family intramembrane metalloprotease [Verrucomicrobiales bacterium]|nr:CPBP family intramembrane metalloprotease [Verrucomicrobiales bacterium]